MDYIRSNHGESANQQRCFDPSYGTGAHLTDKICDAVPAHTALDDITARLSAAVMDADRIACRLLRLEDRLGVTSACPQVAGKTAGASAPQRPGHLAAINDKLDALFSMGTRIDNSITTLLDAI